MTNGDGGGDGGAGGNGGGWVSEDEFASIHGAIREMAAAMGNVGVDSVKVTLCSDGTAHVSVEYALFPDCGCAQAVDNGPRPAAPCALQAVH